MKWWFGLRLKPIFATAPAASKNYAFSKSGQKWLKNNNLGLMNQDLYIRPSLNPWHTLYSNSHIQIVHSLLVDEIQVIVANIQSLATTIIMILGNFFSPIQTDLAKYISLFSCFLFSTLMIQLLLLTLTHLARLTFW